jgi:hypothetical protein
MKIEFSRQFLKKYSNIKFNENPFCGSRVVPCGQQDGRTDMKKLIVVFRIFANVPKHDSKIGDLGYLHFKTSDKDNVKRI